MKKIAISLGVIGIVAAIVIGATTAFFSDTETSTGNTFTAGSIDLKIDNTSYAIDYTIPNYSNPTGELVRSDDNSWDLDDLTNRVFFNFVDLKPGDIGEDTISIHVDNNDAWVCMSTKITANNDVTCTEPELKDDEDCTEPGEGTGELGDEINFVFWADDGDNVLEDDEYARGVFEGTIRDFESTSPRIVADSNGNIFTGTPNTPLTGGVTYYIGKAWCFGNLVANPLEQDNSGNSRTPLTGTGIICDGSQVTNASQSDMIMGDISFYAVQSRNNLDFKCSSLPG